MDVDEDESDSDTLYLAMKLLDGDCLVVFQLIDQTKLEVYIIRASSYYVNKRGLMKLVLAL